MFDLPAAFRQALYRTFILTATALSTAFIRAFLRMDEGDLMIAVLAALAAVRSSAFSDWNMQLRVLTGIISGAVILQYIVSITYDLPFCNVLVPVAASWVFLRIMSGNSAHIVLLTGFLVYTAKPGAYAGAERAVDMLIAGAVAGGVVMLAAGTKQIQRADDPGKPLPAAQAFSESLMLFCGLVLYKSFAIAQGIWITLTIIFICMLRLPDESSVKLVRQRVFAVPAGILLGGIYSASAVAADYRLAYFMPLIAAVGFFMLYYRHDFLLFSLFFMFAFTVYADWMSGAGHYFNFRQLLLARTLATITGTAILLSVEKLSSIFSGNRAGQYEKVS